MRHKKKFFMVLGVLVLFAGGMGAYLGLNNFSSSPSFQFEELQEDTTKPEVISFFPKGEVENLEQTVLVSFSKPMVALKILDQQEDCPLTISPITEGTCRWISTQTVEFTPIKLNPATNYTVSVKKDTIQYTGSFSTPLLKRSVGRGESLREGIQLIFNFPVKKEQLQKDLVVENSSLKKTVDVVVSETETPGIYLLKPKSGVWQYLTNYTFSVKNPLDAKDGNIATPLQNISYTTPDSIVDVQVLKKVNNSGTVGFEYANYSEGYYNNLGDTYYSIQDAYQTKVKYQTLLPLKNVVFDVTFDEVINELSPKIIRVTQNNKPLSYTLSYTNQPSYNEKTRQTEEIITKKKIRIILNESLNKNQTYKVSYAPDGKTEISSRAFNTPSNLKITRILPISYSKVCLYSNNPLGKDTWDLGDMNEKLLEISPSAIIRSIDREDRLPDSVYLYEIKKSEIPQLIKKYDLCPIPEQDEVVYVINTRLNPSSTYDLTFRPQDIYGDTVAPITKKFTTEKIKDKDRFIYIGHPSKNTIPSDLPLVVNIQTINSDKAKIDVCVMDVEQYLTSPSTGCVQSATKQIKIKNKNWLLSNTKIDIEQDILETETQGQIVRISGSANISDPSLNNNKSFSSVFVKSNLALMLENAENKHIMLATDYKGNPIPGLSFQGYVRIANNNYVPTSLSATYDAKQGVYELSSFADVIVASKGKYRGMLEQQTDTKDNYDFGYIAGYNSYEKDFLYVYTERPIYKPGDTVSFKGLMRLFTLNGFTKSRLDGANLVIVSERGKEIISIPVKLDKNSNFDGSFTLPKEGDLGLYTMVLKKSDQTTIGTNANFYVEEYKKPVFKIEVDSGTYESIVGENIGITLHPMYYFGGKLANTEGSYRIMSQKYFFDAKDYSSFQFGEGNSYISCMYRGECDYADRAVPVKESLFTINKDGVFTLNHKVENKPEEAEQIYSFVFEIKDPTTQKAVSKTVSKVIHATDAYVGINLPYWNTKQQGIQLKAVTLNRDAQPKANTTVEVKLIKQDWKAVKKQGVDGVFYNEYSLEEKEELTTTKTSDSKGMIEMDLKPKTDGEYKVVVSYKGNSGVPFVSTQTVYVSGDDPLLWRTENNTITKVIAEKTMVNVGEKAKYTIQSPINTGTIFVAIEKDDGILEHFTMPLTSYATPIELPIKKEYYPNIYIKVFVIGSQENNPLPVFKRGLAISKINTTPQHLTVKIQTDKQLYQPGDKPKITVKIVDVKGNPVANANMSIGIVDQSVLALKGNPVKNPFAYFYDMKRYLGVMTRTSLSTLIEKLELKDASDGSKGGDGESMKGSNSKKKRGIFKDTAYRKANFTTDAQGIAQITADALPDNLTTWVIEVLANTADTKVGVATTTIQSALPIMINPNLPSVLANQDKIVFRPVLFNRTDKDQTLTFKITGNYLKFKNPVQTVNVPAHGDSVISIETEIAPQERSYTLASKITMTAVSKDGKLSDDVVYFVPVVYNSTRETVTTVGTLSGGKALESIDLPSDLQGKLSLTYGKSLFGSLLDGVFMSAFGTYGCLEQRFATFMPHIYVKSLYTTAGIGDKYDFDDIMVKQWSDKFDGYQDISLHNYIKLQLLSIEKFQNTDGGFMFRYDTMEPKHSSVWLTNYIISSLADLRDQGYTVPQKITDKAISYLKKQRYQQHKQCAKQSSLTCGYIAQELQSTLSSLLDWNAQDKEIETMRSLLKPMTEENLSTEGKLEKALFLAKLSQQKSSYKKEASTLLTEIVNKELVMNPKAAYIGKASRGDHTRKTATFLYASSYIPSFVEKNAVIYHALQRRLAEQKKDGSRGSTQDSVQVIKSLTKMIAAFPISQKELNIETLIGKQEMEKVILAKDDPFGNSRIEKGLSEINHNAKIIMTSKPKEKAYYDITLAYDIPAKDVAARYEGFVVKKQYYAYEKYMDVASKKVRERDQYLNGELSYSQLKYPKEILAYLEPITTPTIGQVIVTHITLITSEQRQQVAIENYIPAGAELINYNLSTESKYAKPSNTYQGSYGYGYDAGYDGGEYEEKGVNVQNLACDKEEFRTEKYFCYKEQLEPGVYSIVSLMRMTHEGTFSIKPAGAFEFYHPEVFGRTQGIDMSVLPNK